MKLLAALCCCAGLAHAQDFVRADGPLSDDDFYRLVSCAAPVAGACQKDSIRWSSTDAKDLTVGIVKVAADYPANLHKLADATLNAAISELNRSGANFRLTRSEKAEKPDIAIYLLAIAEGEYIAGTDLSPLDGTRIAAARAQLWWRADRSLINGAIVFAKDVHPVDMTSIMLEEVTQSLGLLTDVEGDYYRSRSIFSESSNQQFRLGPQDIMVLKRHYP